MNEGKRDDGSKLSSLSREENQHLANIKRQIQKNYHNEEKSLRSESSKIEPSFVVFSTNLAITSTEIKQSEHFCICWWGISVAKSSLSLSL